MFREKRYVLKKVMFSRKKELQKVKNNNFAVNRNLNHCSGTRQNIRSFNMQLL